MVEISTSVVESFVRCRRLPSLVVNASGDERDDEVDEDAGGDETMPVVMQLVSRQ
jgi:hypothetical protein